MSRNNSTRPRPLGLLVAALAALVFVGGTGLSLLNSEEGEVEADQGRLSLDALMERTDLVVDASAESIERLGDPSDPGVAVTIQVREAIYPDAGGAGVSVIFDEGFREDWRQGSTMLLFLAQKPDLPSDATHEVVDRCILDVGALPCPYDPAAVAEWVSPGGEKTE